MWVPTEWEDVKKMSCIELIKERDELIKTLQRYESYHIDGEKITNHVWIEDEELIYGDSFNRIIDIFKELDRRKKEGRMYFDDNWVLNKERIEALLKTITKEYRENYDDDYYLYESVDRDVLSSVVYAFQEGKISSEEFKALSDYLLADYIKTASDKICPALQSDNPKIRFKVERLTVNELRIELEDVFAKLEDIERSFQEKETQDKDHWVKIYKLQLLRMDLVIREITHRIISIEDVKIF